MKKTEEKRSVFGEFVIFKVEDEKDGDVMNEVVELSDKEKITSQEPEGDQEDNSLEEVNVESRSNVETEEGENRPKDEQYVWKTE